MPNSAKQKYRYGGTKSNSASGYVNCDTVRRVEMEISPSLIWIRPLFKSTLLSSHVKHCLARHDSSSWHDLGPAYPPRVWGENEQHFCPHHLGPPLSPRQMSTTREPRRNIVLVTLGAETSPSPSRFQLPSRRHRFERTREGAKTTRKLFHCLPSRTA